MSTPGPGLAAPLGLVAGTFTMMFIGRLARFILGMREPPDASGNRAYKGPLGIALLAIVHPAGLILVALLGAAIYFVCIRRSADAAWFFGTLFGTVMLMWALAMRALRQKAKRR